MPFNDIVPLGLTTITLSANIVIVMLPSEFFLYWSVLNVIPPMVIVPFAFCVTPGGIIADPIPVELVTMQV